MEALLPSYEQLGRLQRTQHLNERWIEFIIDALGRYVLVPRSLEDHPDFQDMAADFATMEVIEWMPPPPEPEEG